MGVSNARLRNVKLVSLLEYILESLLLCEHCTPPKRGYGLSSEKKR